MIISKRILLFIALAHFMLAGLLLCRPASASDATVEGQITQISLLKNVLTVDTGSKTASVSILSYTIIVKDNWDADLSNLRSGDKVRIIVLPDRTRGLVALRVEAQTMNKVMARKLKGSLSGISALPGLPAVLMIDPPGMPNQGLILVLVDLTTILMRDGAYASLLDLQAGDNLNILAVVQSDGTVLANRIEASSPRDQQRLLSISGVVKTVSGSVMMVETWKSGMEETLSLDRVRIVRRDKKLASFGEIKRGDQVIAYGTRNASGGITALTLSAQSPDVEWNCKVIAVNTTEGWLLLTPPQGSTPVTVLQLPATVLQINGQDADLGGVVAGDSLTVRGLIHAGGPWAATSLEIVRSARG